MRVASRHTYAASPDSVFAALTAPEVLTEKYSALGHRDIEVTQHADRGERLRVRSRRGVPMDVPAFARRFLSPVNTVEQTDEWETASADGARRGTWKVSAARVPVSVGGTLSLAPARGGGTVVEITGDITCSIPLVGGKLASFVGGDVERTIHAEEEFNDGYLAKHAAKPRQAPAKRRAAV